MHFTLGGKVQFRNWDTKRCPQSHIGATWRKCRRLPPPNFYGAGDGDGAVDTSGDTGKADRGGPGRSFDIGREAYIIAQGYERCRSE